MGVCRRQGTVEVQRCYNRLLKEGRVREHKTLGKSLSAGMVRGIHAFLHEAFDAAVREHVAVKNPTEGVTLPKVSNIERTPLTDCQVEIFLRVIRDDRPVHACYRGYAEKRSRRDG